MFQTNKQTKVSRTHTHTPRLLLRTASTDGYNAPTKRSWGRRDGPPLAAETSENREIWGYTCCLSFDLGSYYGYNTFWNCGWVSHFVTGSTECQHSVDSLHPHVTCSGLPRTCWCALIPILDGRHPAARCWICTASLKATTWVLAII